MRRIVILLLISFFVFSCRSKNEIESVASEEFVPIDLQQSEYDSGDSLWMEWERQLQRLLHTHQVNTGEVVSRKDVEKTGAAESALAQLNTLERLLAEYRLIHGELNADIWDERRRYAQLKSEFEKQSRELQYLQLEIENLVQRISAVQFALINSQLSNDSLVNELNRVYFAFGTAAELEKAEVVKIKSGWWNSAERVKLKKNLNTDYFSPGDQRQLKELSLFSDNAILLTPHPTGSFEMRTVASGAQLIITDSEKFWEQSRYLAVKVD